MSHPSSRTYGVRSRAPGSSEGRRWRRSSAPPLSHRPPVRTLFASGLALWLCVLATFVLAMPGFALGTEGPAPQATAGETGFLQTSAAETGAAAVVSPLDGPAPPASAVSTGTVLTALAWGDGLGEVGLLAPGEGLSRGPEAVAVAPDGRIAILDSVNGRLVLLDATGAFTRNVSVSLGEPRFLAVTDDRMFVLDFDRDRQVVALAWTGEELARFDLPNLDDVVTGLFATERGPCVEIAHETTCVLENDRTSENQDSLSTLPGRPLDRGMSRAVKAGFRPGTGFRVETATMDKRTLKAVARRVAGPDIARGRALEHLVSVDGDGRDGLIVGARLLMDKCSQGSGPGLLVTHLPAGALGTRGSTPADLSAASAGLKVTDELLLSDSGYAYLGQPYAVAPDGRVIQPIADETGYKLLVHVFPSVKEVRP